MDTCTPTGLKLWHGCWLYRLFWPYPFLLSIQFSIQKDPLERYERFTVELNGIAGLARDI